MTKCQFQPKSCQPVLNGLTPKRPTLYFWQHKFFGQVHVSRDLTYLGKSYEEYFL